jgi:hypothetical protein
MIPPWSMAAPRYGTTSQNYAAAAWPEPSGTAPTVTGADIATRRPPLPSPNRLVASATWLVATALVTVAILEGLFAGDPYAAHAADVIVAPLLVLAFASVGAILVTRLPRHAIGWLLLVVGLLFATTIASQAIADYGLYVQAGALPGAIWIAWLGQVTWVPAIGLAAIFLPLLYPTGRLPSARWRLVVVIALIGLSAVITYNALGPWQRGTFPGFANPLALGGPAGSLVEGLHRVANLLALPAILLAATSLVVRFRRAQGVERQQLKWFLSVVVIAAPALLVAILGAGLASDAGWLVGLVCLALLPLAIGIAVLRYRLYEIDRLISRTIGWAAVTLILGATFVAVILVLQTLVAPLTGSNELAVAGSTLLVAALFQPLRGRVQRLVDRRFNRSRYDAERTVAALAARLRDEVDLDAVRADILATVDAALEPSMSSLWLRG